MCRAWTHSAPQQRWASLGQGTLHRWDSPPRDEGGAGCVRWSVCPGTHRLTASPSKPRPSACGKHPPRPVTARAHFGLGVRRWAGRVGCARVPGHGDCLPQFLPRAPSSAAAGPGLGNTQELQSLLQNMTNCEFNVNSFGPEGQTALHQSVIDGNLELVKLLVKFGADIRLANRDGWSALHIAAFGGHQDIVLYLITKAKYAGGGRASVGAWVLGCGGDGDTTETDGIFDANELPGEVGVYLATQANGLLQADPVPIKEQR
nr:PREDICTED: notch-regulated ankyrin repeat-containing protein [Bos mutus]